MNARTFALLFALAPASACSKSPGDAAPLPPAPAPPPASTGASASSAAQNDSPSSVADTIFKTRCATCHGTDGKGNGPAAMALNPKPRNYADAAWQKSVSDAQIRDIILKGGMAVGKSPLMPPSQDLESKPEVVDALVKKVRACGPT